MSLHISNVSSRVRIDELERVFCKFGRCDVRLKGKYGFVDYDSPPDAERAFLALQGRNVCGERIIVKWSNRQHKPGPKYFSNPRSYGSGRGRNDVSVESYEDAGFASNAGQGYGSSKKERDSGDHGTLKSAKMLDDDYDRYCCQDVDGKIGETGHSTKDDFAQEISAMGTKVLDDDRWCDRLGETKKDRDVENEMEFDRYEPHHSDDVRDVGEIQKVQNPRGSPTYGKNHEKARPKKIGGASFSHSDDLTKPVKCYTCGELGHRKRNCPQVNASRRTERSRLDNEPVGDIRYRDRYEDEIDTIGSRGRGRVVKDNRLTEQNMNEDKSHSSPSLGNGNSPTRNGACKARSKEYIAYKRRRNDGATESNSGKRARNLLSLPLSRNEDSVTPALRSQLPKAAHLSSSPSRLGSVSSRKLTLPSSPIRHSRSDFSDSESSKTRSGARSSTPVSLNQSLATSPSKVQKILKDFPNFSPKSKETLVSDKQVEFLGVAGLDKMELDYLKVPIDDGNMISTISCEDGTDEGRLKNHEDDNQNTPDIEIVEDTCIQLLNEDAVTSSRSPPVMLSEKMDGPSGSTENEHIVDPTERSLRETKINSGVCQPTRLTPEELLMVLQHYGLELPEGNEMHSSVEDYLGSARLWSWAIIYYRRLKKGPISKENYKRRISQNEEFGIVDKYIRSSSGWGELDQDNLTHY